MRGIMPRHKIFCSLLAAYLNVSMQVASPAQIGSDRMMAEQIKGEKPLVTRSHKIKLAELNEPEIKSDPTRIFTLLNLASVAQSKMDRTLADDYYAQALKMAGQEPANPTILAQVNLCLAEYHKQFHEEQRAITYAQKALDYAKVANDSDLYAKCLEFKANILMRIGRTQDAIKCFTELATIKKAEQEGTVR
jgi:tetratricopeptide (TPR) repeat protein